MFTVKLDDIPEEGLNLNWEEQRDSLVTYLRHRSSIDFDFETPLHAEARITRTGKAYLIQGSLQTLLRLRCARCLEEFPYPLSSAFDLSLHSAKGTSFEEEVELDAEDMESNFFEGGEIHLSEVACEQIFLEIPFQPLCSEDCKGLCPQCGRDRNLSSCDCSQEDWEAGFSVLRKLKLDPS